MLAPLSKRACFWFLKILSWTCCRKRSELALRMLGSMSRHLHALVGLIDDLTLKNVQARLVCWLLKRCGKPLGGDAVVISLDQTKSLLASEFGTTSETLSR